MPVVSYFTHPSAALYINLSIHLSYQYISPLYILSFYSSSLLSLILSYFPSLPIPMSFSSPIFSLFTHQPTPSFSLPIITNLPYPYHLRPFLALLLITIFFTFSLTLFTNIFFSLSSSHHQTLSFSHFFSLSRLPSSPVFLSLLYPRTPSLQNRPDRQH